MKKAICTCPLARIPTIARCKTARRTHRELTRVPSWQTTAGRLQLRADGAWRLYLFADRVDPSRLLGPSLVFGEVMASQGTGSIINISSMASEQALSGVLGYSVAKAGIDNLTRWMASDLARQCGPGIRVNAVAPGFFISTQNRAVLVKPDGSYSDRARSVIAKTPMGRFGDPEELNGAIQWLCSDAASFVTGAVIPVDGGFSAFSGV